MTKIRVAVVDDHALFRAGLISLLNEIADFQIVGEAGDGQGALEVVRRSHPDILLLDVNMPGMSGVEAVRALKGDPATERCRVIMLTISKNEEDLMGAIAAGADGYLLKNAEPDELHKAILQVHQGMSVLSPQVTRQVLKAALSSELGHSPESGLSAREMEVLACLAQGKTTAQIANELYISENTVKTHVRHILEKLTASNRAEAVSKATQMGLI
ncbi:MAG: response regulator transcription factor [Anaerolineae bacterium]|jgi:DNA-binding NarL/FixJ family response regulator|nr:response regulator transcription factor [Anaerolineae bacterium]MCZ7551672.1 response regulator transcription factor [Anaerolineales bacterium]